jgi:SAM-dependent methyltransferase
MIGARCGVESLVYNRFVMEQFHDEALRDAPLVVPVILKMFPSAVALLDVGCGSGAFAAEFARHGRKVVGLERSSSGRALAAKQGVECRHFDLTRTPPAMLSEPFDLIYSFEVAEHLTVELGDRLVGYLASFAAPVIFSAAQPGQGGTGHMNEQLPGYWLDRFARFAFVHDAVRTTELKEALKTNGAAPWFQNNPTVIVPAALL